MKEGLVDGLVLANAGIKRLVFTRLLQKFLIKIVCCLQLVSTVVVQTRENNHKVINLLKSVNDKETEYVSIAERSCLKKLTAHVILQSE